MPLASDVDSLEGLLMWRNAWRSAKAFVVGLYLLVCIKVYLDSGAQGCMSQRIQKWHLAHGVVQVLFWTLSLHLVILAL